MRDDMYDMNFFKYGTTFQERLKMYQESNFTSGLQNVEMTFDAADLLRFGKDVLVRKGQSCNNLGLEWLRREFPDLRFHQLILSNDFSRHADEAVVPIRGPTAGSPGIAFLHQNQICLEDSLKIFKDNDWRLIQLPPIQNDDCFCL
jgi:glycine amidinotransferase